MVDVDFNLDTLIAKRETSMHAEHRAGAELSKVANETSSVGAPHCTVLNAAVTDANQDSNLKSRSVSR